MVRESNALNILKTDSHHARICFHFACETQKESEEEKKGNNKRVKRVVLHI